MRKNSATLVSNNPVPAGSRPQTDWETSEAGETLYRLLTGKVRCITDSDAYVQTWATQLTDGAIDDGSAFGEEPHVEVPQVRLNSDQARELAAALLECAAELDRWSQK